MTGGNVTVTGRCGILERGAEIAVLHHRREVKRTLSVKINADSSISRASEFDGKWTIPMDLVGIEGKRMTNVKVRIHPAVFEINHNEKFFKFFDKTVRELISSILGDDWSLTPVTRADPRLESIRKIRKMFSVSQTIVEYHPESITVIFPLVGKNKRELKSFYEGRKAVGKGTVLKAVTEAEEKLTSVKLMFVSDNLVESLWEMNLASGYVHGEGNITISSSCLILSVTRVLFDLPRVPAMVGKIGNSITFDDQGKQHMKAMDSAQEIVNELRRRLDLSLQVYGRRATGVDVQKNLRIIEVLHKNTDEVVFQIAKPSAMDAIRAARRLLRPSSPLNVEVTNIEGDSHGSPLGSVDSGMGGSPATSPKTPPSSPFYKYNESMRILSLRHRSYSESCPGLKGILKWPQARTSFARSMSECHSDEKEVASTLSRTPTFEEDESGCDDSSDCSPVAIARMTRRTSSKRVSFSEHVEEKVFRKGSSILCQQAKNEKRKQRKERKRAESIEECGHEHVLENDVFDEPCIKAGNRTSRQDSGFCEGKDDNVTVREDSEQSWMRMVRTQRKRWSSESQVFA